jgi:hypothetical protein
MEPMAAHLAFAQMTPRGLAWLPDPKQKPAQERILCESTRQMTLV